VKFKIWNNQINKWVVCSHRQARHYAMGGRMIGPFKELHEVLFDRVSKGLTNNLINERLSRYSPRH
jgi:hypothetical protein